MSTSNNQKKYGAAEMPRRILRPEDRPGKPG
jgi:hypothetical protein